MRSIDRVISERMKTPVNEWEEERGKVKSLFKNLKKPENMIEFDIPEEEEEEEEDVVLDAEEVERIEQEKNRLEEQKRLMLETEVIKRGLLRPKTIPSQLKPSSKSRVHELI